MFFDRVVLSLSIHGHEEGGTFYSLRKQWWSTAGYTFTLPCRSKITERVVEEQVADIYRDEEGDAFCSRCEQWLLGEQGRYTRTLLSSLAKITERVEFCEPFFLEFIIL